MLCGGIACVWGAGGVIRSCSSGWGVLLDFRPELFEDESSVKILELGGALSVGAVNFFLKSRIRLVFRFSQAKSKGVIPCWNEITNSHSMSYFVNVTLPQREVFYKGVQARYVRLSVCCWINWTYTWLMSYKKMVENAHKIAPKENDRSYFLKILVSLSFLSKR